jgi:hypothetical protein
MKTKVKCPKCNSIKNRPFSVIYEEQAGIQLQDGRFKGTSFSKNNLNLIRGKFRSETQFETYLSQKIAPPELPSSNWLRIICTAIKVYFIWVIVSSILLTLDGGDTFVIYSFIILFFGFIVALYLDIQQFIYAKKAYPQKLEEWYNSYRCFQCGCLFITKK